MNGVHPRMISFLLILFQLFYFFPFAKFTELSFWKLHLTLAQTTVCGRSSNWNLQKRCEPEETMAILFACVFRNNYCVVKDTWVWGSDRSGFGSRINCFFLCDMENSTRDSCNLPKARLLPVRYPPKHGKQFKPLTEMSWICMKGKVHMWYTEYSVKIPSPTFLFQYFTHHRW